VNATSQGLVFYHSTLSKSTQLNNYRGYVRNAFYSLARQAVERKNTHPDLHTTFFTFHMPTMGNTRDENNSIAGSNHSQNQTNNNETQIIETLQSWKNIFEKLTF
jgi:hypothetical protein